MPSSAKRGRRRTGAATRTSTGGRATQRREREHGGEGIVLASLLRRHGTSRQETRHELHILLPASINQVRREQCFRLHYFFASRDHRLVRRVKPLQHAHTLDNHKRGGKRSSLAKLERRVYIWWQWSPHLGLLCMLGVRISHTYVRTRFYCLQSHHRKIFFFFSVTIT